MSSSSVLEFDLPVIDAPGSEAFSEIVAAGSPVVLRGAIDDWPARELWSLDRLAERAGHRMVPVEFYGEGSWFGPWQTVQMTFSRYLAVVRSPGDAEMCYLAQTKLDDYLPELVDDVRVPGALSGQHGLGAAFFLGNQSITALHYHSRDEALLCMISGRKEVTLYSPEDFEHLDYHRWPTYRFNFSRIDFLDDLQSAHPGLLKAQPYRVVLEPGDALFIPLFWSHWTRNLDIGTSLTYFWPAENRWSPAGLAVRSRLGNLFRDRVSQPVMDTVERIFGFA